MIILGIETSCDETACAILKKDQNGIHILSNVVTSSAQLQAKYGGVIPEQAAREQIKSIIPVIEEALFEANLTSHPRPDPRSIYIDSRLRGNDKKDRGNDKKDRGNDKKDRGNDELGIDAIAVTYGPGLIGSLLVGVETAKVLAKVWNKPLIPVNHLLGHFYANWISPPSLRDHEVAKQSIIEIATSVAPLLPRNDSFSVPSFPCLGLLVSGGHTDLVLFTDHGKYKYLGGTRDDAAGECFDKCARLLGLPYPGGPALSKLAEKGDPNKFKLPVPMKGQKDFDFSYSGLKTAVANLLLTSEESKPCPSGRRATSEVLQTPEVREMQPNQTSGVIADLAAAIEATIIISLIDKVILAIKKYQVEQLMIAGGVAANQTLVKKLLTLTKDKTISLHVPPPNLCTDNGAMIAASGFFQKPIPDPLALQADPSLSLDLSR